MSNISLHITSPVEVTIRDKVVELFPNTYKNVNESVCKENDFIQCFKCNDWFDEAYFITQYHPQFDESNQNNYCESCFNSIYK